LAPGSRVRRSLGFGGFSVAGPCHARPADQVADGDHEALARGVVASGAGVVGATQPVVRDIEELLEHHWVRHAREIPFCVPV
jgi:hypothetical protein